MRVESTTEAPLNSGADTIVIGAFEGEGVPHDLPGEPLGALLASGEARRDLQALAVTHAEGRRLILAGLGARAAFAPERARAIAALAHGRARELGGRVLCWELPHHVSDDIAAGLVQGTVLHAYQFDRYKPASDRPGFEQLIVSAHHDVSGPVAEAGLVSAAQNRARDLGNTPGNDLTPTALADYATQLAERLEGLTVTVMDETEIRAAGMGAFAAVAQGSAQGARLIRLEYEGPSAAEAPRLALVGKGVTFDSGGLSLKPAAKMHEMKFDMGGAAAVIEAIAALSELRAPARVLAVVGATENLPGATAIKPGDIVRALDGTTIEINNTDAEGRLVLADCLTHAQREGCDAIVDVATLTGGCVIALGSVHAGLLSNDDAWAQELEGASARSGELIWRLPLHPEYAEMVKGRYAQLTNMTEQREASPIAGAEFLHHFVGDVPWAHLDIAGMADNVRRPYFVGKGATGFGVRLLVELALARVRT